MSVQFEHLGAMLPYASSLASGVNLLPTPWAIVPDVMSPSTQQTRLNLPQQPAAYVQNNYAYPYPIQTPYPYYMPPLQQPMLPTQPLPPAQSLPNTPSPVADAQPVIVSLRDVTQNLNSTNKMDIRQGVDDLGQLIKGNPDFKSPKAGSIPESILKKALKVQDEKILVRLLLNMQGMQTVSPGVVQALRPIARSSSLMPETRDLANQLMSKSSSGQRFSGRFKPLVLKSTLDNKLNSNNLPGQVLDLMNA